MLKKKVYLDAGTLEQFQSVVAEYESQEGSENLEFVFLTSGCQITEFPAEIWSCRKLDRQLQNFQCTYHIM